MAENIFQSIRGAQFRGSRFPGFRSTGQQADSGVDPVTAELAAQNRDSWTGPRASTALGAQSFGGSDFSASTAPAGASAPNGGTQVADAVSRGIDAITPNVSTTGGIISTVGRVGGALVGGLPGLALGGAAKAGGAYYDALDYDRQLSERGLPGIDRPAAVFSALNPFEGKESPNKGANQFADRIAAESRTLANSPIEAENLATYQDSTNANPSGGPQSWTGDNVSPGQAAQSLSTSGQGNPEDTGGLFGGSQDAPSEGLSGPAADPFSGGDPYGGSDPQGGSTSEGSSGGGGGDTGGGGPSDNGSGGSGFYKGGHVTRDRLTGPNPPGPDDGYAALDVGETVITAAATRRYGKDVMAALNKGLVSREAVRRLLG
jgi:hypothetical protein